MCSGKCGDLEALGLTEVVNMDVVNQDHPKLFSVLFKAMLKYRLNEIDFSRVSNNMGLLPKFMY